MLSMTWNPTKSHMRLVCSTLNRSSLRGNGMELSLQCNPLMSMCMLPDILDCLQTVKAPDYKSKREPLNR